MWSSLSRSPAVPSAVSCVALQEGLAPRKAVVRVVPVLREEAGESPITPAGLRPCSVALSCRALHKLLPTPPLLFFFFFFFRCILFNSVNLTGAQGSTGYNRHNIQEYRCSKHHYTGCIAWETNSGSHMAPTTYTANRGTDALARFQTRQGGQKWQLDLHWCR